MANYYYDKYTVNQTTYYNDDATWVNIGSATKYWGSMASYYEHDNVNNTYSLHGGHSSVSYGTTGYELDGSGNLIKWIVSENISNMAANGNYISSGSKRTKTENSTYIEESQGSLVESSIIAANGTYPDNGKHTDGYWYVKGAEVINSAPSAPGAFTSPSTNLNPGTAIIVSWGSSSDSEGDALRYYLEVSYNGGVYSSIGNTTNTSLGYTVTTDSTLTTITFRVRAYDGSVYGSYRYSNTYSILHNTLPGLTLTAPDSTSITNSAVLNTKYKNTPIKVGGTDADADALEYQVSIKGTVVQLWTPLTNGEINYDFDSFADLGLGSNAVTVSIRDGKGGQVDRNFTIRNKTPKSYSLRDIFDVVDQFARGKVK